SRGLAPERRFPPPEDGRLESRQAVAIGLGPEPAQQAGSCIEVAAQVEPGNAAVLASGSWAQPILSFRAVLHGKSITYCTYMPTTLELVGRHSEADDVISFFFRPEQPLPFVAGQFVDLTLAHAWPDDRGITRCFTIASAPSEQLLQFTTRIGP